MNKKLLTATLVAAISGISFAETPNDNNLTVVEDRQQLHTDKLTELRQKLAALTITHPELAELLNPLIEEDREKEAQADSILNQDSSEIKKDLAEKLGNTTSQE